MKKIISLTFLLFILSCTSNDNQASTDTGLLCNKKVKKDVNGNLISETNFTYDGNKLVKAIETYTSGSGELKFYYTGDLITKVDYYYNNTLTSTNSITYNSQQNPIQRVLLDYTSNTGTKYVYNYNTDLLITGSEYRGDLTSQNQLYSNFTKTYTKTNGEITSYNEINTLISGGTGYRKTNNYFYDSKNNYMKNVLGYGKITILIGNFSDPYNQENYCNQNVTQLQTSNNTFGSTPRNIVTLYTYNSNNYPISETQTIYSGGSTTSNYISNSWYYYN
jgi:hypothetical protein